MEDAISHAKTLLELKSDYRFEHRGDIDYYDAHFIIAEASFHLGDLDEARSEIEYLYESLDLGSPGLPRGHNSEELEAAILEALSELAARLTS